MISYVEIKTSKNNPSIPLMPIVSFVNSNSTVAFLDIPKDVTQVSIQLTVNDSLQIVQATKSNDAWICTIPSYSTVCEIDEGYTVNAVDDKGNTLIIGKGNVRILPINAVPTDVDDVRIMRIRDTIPTNPNKGDCVFINSVLRVWNGNAWRQSCTPFTLNPATDETLGGVIVGNGLSVDELGVIGTTLQPYTLPIATTSSLGGIKVGNTLSVDGNGVLNTQATSGSQEVIQLCDWDNVSQHDDGQPIYITTKQQLKSLYPDWNGSPITIVGSDRTFAFHNWFGQIYLGYRKLGNTIQNYQWKRFNTLCHFQTGTLIYVDSQDNVWFSNDVTVDE